MRDSLGRLPMPPSNAAILRDAILSGLDHLLAQDGFSRPKRSYQWLRNPAPGVVQGIHLNFGRVSGDAPLHIIPSLQAGIEAVERELAAAGLKKWRNNSCTFSYQLAHILGCEYVAYVDQGAQPIVTGLVADIRRHGFPRLERLASLETVAKLMLSSDPKEWPVAWASLRARTLPVVLALLGRHEEARTWLNRLSADLAGQDQLRPTIEQFSAWFASRFGQAA